MNTANIKYELNKLKLDKLAILINSLATCMKLLPEQLVAELHLKSIKLIVKLVYDTKREELRKHLNKEVN